MSIRQLLMVGIIASLVCIPGVPRISSADAPAAGARKKVAGFTLTDPRDQSQVSLADFKDKKAIVVVFLGTECPVNNAYLPTLEALHKEYTGKGVQFLAVNANRQDSAERVAAHAKKNGLSFPVLKDPEIRVADQFAAVRTPEAFLIDAKQVIRYQGRIDDQFGIGYQRPRANRRDLAEAIDAVLAGKDVAEPKTVVSGCLIGRNAEAKKPGDITYTKEVSRIIQNNCQECHRPNHIGPMALLTYRDVAAWSGTIREVVTEGRMPPWHADPRFGKFSNDRSLSKEDRETLLAWIEQGCRIGDEKDLPPAKEFVAGWRIGKPDAIFRIPEEFEVPATAPKNGIPYKYFQVPTDFKEDKWIERAEAHPDVLDVVHHIIVFIVPPGQRFNSGDPSSRVLCGTAPGDMPLIVPEGTAKKIPAGSTLVFQMHYTPNGKAVKDRSSVGVVFAKQPPKRQVFTRGISNPRFKIPAGDDNYKVESTFTFQENGRILNFMPHMHLRGKSFEYEVIYPDEKKQILLSVPKFDFAWQSVYRFIDPPFMPKGTRVHCTAHFDNSEKNLNNPDPSKPVTWGDQTWEEMMIGWMDFVYDRPPE